MRAARAHAGAAEFHHQQILQRNSFPLVTRERTILRMASSTSSMVKAGGIQIDGVRSLRQRRVGARAVALVALPHLCGELPGVTVSPLARISSIPAAHALVGIRIQKDLDVGLREHHGADVAAFHHHAGPLADLPLLRHHGAPHARNHGDLGGAVGNFGRADGVRDVLAVERDLSGGKLDLRRDRKLLHAMHVGGIDALAHRPQRHRAVHRAGIDVGESEARGQPFGDGALARARRPVDRDHYALLCVFRQKSG